MKSLRIRLPDELHRAAKIKAAKTDTTMAEICRCALKKWIEEDDPPETEKSEK